MPYRKPRAWLLPPDVPLLDPSDSINWGLVGRWPLSSISVGQTAPDLSPYRNNGTLVGGPLLVPGRAGKALSFNGSSQYVTANTNAPAGDLTISAWIKPTSILAFSAAVSNNGPAYLGMSTSGKVWVRMDTSLTTLADKFSLAGDIVANVWTHIMGVHMGGNIYIYVNGRLSNGAHSCPGTTNAYASVQIANGPGANKFPGAVYDVRIFNRAPWDSERSRLYSDPFAGLIRPPGRRIVSAGASGVTFVQIFGRAGSGVFGRATPSATAALAARAAPAAHAKATPSATAALTARAAPATHAKATPSAIAALAARTAPAAHAKATPSATASLAARAAAGARGVVSFSSQVFQIAMRAGAGTWGAAVATAAGSIVQILMRASAGGAARASLLTTAAMTARTAAAARARAPLAASAAVSASAQTGASARTGQTATAAVAARARIAARAQIPAAATANLAARMSAAGRAKVTPSATAALITRATAGARARLAFGASVVHIAARAAAGVWARYTPGIPSTVVGIGQTLGRLAVRVRALAGLSRVRGIAGPARVRSIKGGTTMYAGADFTDASVSEGELYSFDFTTTVGNALDAPATVNFTLAVVDGTDASVASRIGSTTLSGFVATTKLTGLQPGVRYRLAAVATLASGQTKELYSFVNGVAESV